MREPIKKPRFPWWLGAIVVLVGVALVVSGAWLAVSQDQHAKESIENDLLAIGQLKAEQIAGWRAERLGDAGVIAEGPSAANLVQHWLTSGTAADRAVILAWFAALQHQYGYADVRLVDPQGAVLLSLGAGDPLAPAAADALRTAFSEREAVLTDLHAETGGGVIHLDSIAPLFDSAGGDGHPLAAVVLTADAKDFLFPLIQTWPIVSASAETLLVERVDGGVVFLNELRFQQGTALTLEFPLTQTDLPAVMAVLGSRDIVRGHDYRGAEVVAALRAVPDSPWFIVAKIDTAEAFAQARTRVTLIVVVVALLLVAMGGTTALLWQQVVKRRYQQAYDSEISRATMAARYEHIVQQANDIILLSDEHARLVEVNERALETYGYTREEMIGMPVAELIPADGLPAFEERMCLLEHADSYILEAAHQRKDGSVFPVEISARTVVAEAKPYLQAIIRDLTERRRRIPRGA